jgi:hypothetical protein
VLFFDFPEWNQNSQFQQGGGLEPKGEWEREEYKGSKCCANEKKAVGGGDGTKLPEIKESYRMLKKLPPLYGLSVNLEI